MKITFKQAYNKIIEAYFKDEIILNNKEFCICGTLSPDHHWSDENDHKHTRYPYSLSEYYRIEQALFSVFPEIKYMGIGYTSGNLDEEDISYEEKLFNGMCAAIDVLREIHTERGENIDEKVTIFKKRELSLKNNL